MHSLKYVSTHIAGRWTRTRIRVISYITHVYIVYHMYIHMVKLAWQMIYIHYVNLPGFFIYLSEVIHRCLVCDWKFCWSLHHARACFYLIFRVRKLDKSLGLVFDPKKLVESCVSDFFCDFTSHFDPSHLAYFGTHPIILLSMRCWRRHAL